MNETIGKTIVARRGKSHLCARSIAAGALAIGSQAVVRWLWARSRSAPWRSDDLRSGGWPPAAQGLARSSSRSWRSNGYASEIW